MTAHSPNHWTIVSWEFAIWWTSIKGHPTDATDIISGIPSPGGYGVPACDVHLESVGAECAGFFLRGSPCGHDVREALSSLQCPAFK